ncbi:MAG: Kelch repeat-containing protein [Thermoplasmata archaeon]
MTRPSNPFASPVPTRLSLIVAVAILIALPPVAFTAEGLPAPPSTASTPSGTMASGPVASTLLAQARASLATSSPTAGAAPLPCHGDVTWADGACLARRFPAASLPPSSTNVTWTPSGPTPPAQADYFVVMTYDASDQYVLLLGRVAGQYGTPGATDAWTYRAGNWTPLVRHPMPQSCAGSVMAYDDTDGYVVYVAGSGSGYDYTPCPSAGETWTYHAGRWMLLNLTSSPPSRYGASMTNDSSDGYLLLFGGSNGSCVTKSLGYQCNDTWTFSNGTWNQLHPVASPSNRSDAGLAYDAKDGYVVLFGGSTQFTALSDTWTFHAGNWTEIYPATSPPVPYPDGFAYDPADGVVVYTNTLNYTIAGVEMTWTFSAGNWTNVNPTSGPVSRLGPAEAFDGADGYLLLFGGLGYSYFADTWSFVGGNWSNRTPLTPSPRWDAAIAYDAADAKVLLFGGDGCSPVGGGCTLSAGTFLNDTWAFSGREWTQLFPTVSPPARSRAGLVYDAADGTILLFGGVGALGPLNDTWTFASGAWTRVPTTSAPSPRSATQMVYDAHDGVVLLFGGDPQYPANRDIGGLRDTWSYLGGTWANLTSSLATSPPGEASNPLAYDAAEGEVVLFGIVALASSFPASEPMTWTFAAGTWTNRTLTSGPAPPARSDASVAYDPASGAVVVFGGVGVLTSKTLNDTWAFFQGRWRAITSDLSPENRSSAAFVADPKAGDLLLVGGTPDSSVGGTRTLFGCPTDVCSDVWTFSGRIENDPVVSSFTVAPGLTEVGVTVSVAAQVAGGSPPYTYSYSGLPPGCSSVDASSFVCNPSQAGSYLLELTVTDQQGNTSNVSTLLRVADRLAVAASTLPSIVTYGDSAVIAITVGGGVAPFSASYPSLPPGCVSANVLSLSCAPTATGNFVVAAAVVDALGARGTSNATLHVVLPGTSPGPLIRGANATPSNFVLGNATEIALDAIGGAGPLTYTYAGLPNGCLSENLSRLGCAPTAAGTYSVVATVTDSARASASIGITMTVEPAQVGASAVVTEFAAIPSTVRVGGEFTLVLVAAGGSPPLAFVYHGLPPGCTSASVADLPCSPTTGGTYRVEAVVTDAAGQSVGVITRVTVRPPTANPLTLVALDLAFVDPTLGHSLTLTVVVGGGNGVRTYTFLDLPPGCPAMNASTISCTPTSAGTFRVIVNVTDTSGGSVGGSITFEVAPSAGTPPSTASPPGVLVYAALAGGLLAGAVAGALALLLFGRRRGRLPGTPDRPPRR